MVDGDWLTDNILPSVQVLHVGGKIILLLWWCEDKGITTLIARPNPPRATEVMKNNESYIDGLLGE